MKALIVVSLLASCLLWVRTAPVAAQASGPTCLRIVEFEEVLQVFALPTGGGQFILTGASLTFGDAFTGSGYVAGSDFIFSLASGFLPGFLEGVLSLNTGKGFGSATFADSGETESLRYSIFELPCTLP
jgi:hypothetical protein